VTAYFQRQLAIYAQYHRDPRNCATHYVGIPAIFLAVLLPLALWPMTIGGWHTTLAAVLLIPAVLGWIALDARIGTAMLLVIVPLLLLAEWIARASGPTSTWTMAAALFAIGWALQIVGHVHFERRRPALVDNLFQMFIGPMFMTAKILVGLGLRSDLAEPPRGAAE
jgi:uncharacterized membrane protein YGL010W